ncbi:MAG: glycosyltransferase [bacterium]|nr:glycosyltransferase [bacterium]
MQSSPLVSVIILNYNGMEFVQNCLESVLNDDYTPKEIILADNGSRDGSMTFARRYEDRVTLMEHGANYGFPKGCNLAIQQARGDFIVLLNIDTVVRPGWLRELIAPMLDDPRVGITGSKLLFFDGKTVQFAGGEISPNGLTHHRGYNQPDDTCWDVSYDAEYITGASMAFRTSALLALGGLDEGFPLYFEDVDISMRFKQAGYQTLYQPASVVCHYETFGTKKRSWKYFYKYHRGRVRLILKNFGASYFFKTFLPAEFDWIRRFAWRHQLSPLLCAYAAQFYKAPGFWLIGALRRRNSMKSFQ